MLYYAQGNAIMTADEIFEPEIFKSLTGFFDNVNKGLTPAPLSLPTGDLKPEDAGKLKVANDVVGFNRIGLGLPLSVMVREVYTGKFPKSGFFGAKKEDMLVTSAIKSIATLDAKPRALNYLKKKVSARSRMERPGASEQGTPHVFYSPALLERSLTMDVTIAFDSFDQEIFEQIGNTFSSAAGIPLFVTQSFYLIAAGVITKLIGKIGEAIFDATPEFESSDALDIFLPGSQPLPAGFVLITADNIDSVDPTFRTKHKVSIEGRVVEVANEENVYSGDVPYVVISVDGTPDEELKTFTPTAVSAAVMSRFFNIKEGKSAPFDLVIEALKLYNDVSFRKQIEALDKKIAAETNEAAKEELKKKRAALQANILEELLKAKE
jgi:hypothetical protein